jgi:membrane protein DedA with SNARE-associated domain
MLQSLMAWYLAELHAGGYWLVAALMAAESSILPVPSELVIPMAAHVAVTHGSMSVPGVIFAGTVGSWVGASLMYWGARLVGRPLILRYGKFALVPEKKLVQAEAWSDRFGAVGIFISRLLPVIRHLIGLPAGLVRLHYGWYSLATLAGAALWCSVLAYVGVKAGEDAALLQGDLSRLSLWLIGAALVVGTLYYFLVHRLARAVATATRGSSGQ